MTVLEFTEPISPDVLPRHFSLSLSADELVAVTEWAARYAPSSNVSVDIDCCFLPGGRRRWVVREANVVGWLDFPDDSQPASGAVTLPLHFLHSVRMADHLDDGTELSVEVEEGRVSAKVGEVVVRTELTGVPESVLSPLPQASLRSHATSIDVAAAVAPLRPCPVAPGDDGPGEGRDSFPWPFIALSADALNLRFVRDWREFGQPKVETEVDTWGDEGLEASFFAEVVLRELYLADEMQGDVVTFGLFADEPAVMVVSAGNWGMLVTLGSEVVLRHRADIEISLESAEIAHDEDPHVGWNPLVVASLRDRRVDVRLVRGTTLRASYVRVSTVVTGGVSWNAELANEINLWNDKWFDTKLVLVDGELVVAHDVPVGSIEQLPAIMNDVVDKSLIVYDVVGVFM